MTVFFLLLGTKLGHEEAKEPKSVTGVHALSDLNLNLVADSSNLTPHQKARLRQSIDTLNSTIAALDTTSPRMAPF